MKEVDYESKAKQLLIQGYATVEGVKQLASILEKADKFDKIKELISDE